MQSESFVSYLYYWPSVDWLANALQFSEIIIPDISYNKQLKTNQTTIATADGALQLSIPLQGGRSTKAKLSAVQASYAENWKADHLRSIASAYGNAPFFEEIFPRVQELYSQSFEHLHDWHLATLQFFTGILKHQWTISFSDSWAILPDSMQNKDYQYPQVFADKVGFVPHCSALDLVMNEGRLTKSILMNISL
jgi:hypothetical protein